MTNTNQTLLRFRRAIALAGLTQKALAERLDVTPRTVSRWLAGDSEPSLSMASRIASELGCELGSIWTAARQPSDGQAA